MSGKLCTDVEQVLKAMRRGIAEVEFRGEMSPEAVGLIAEALRDNESLQQLTLSSGMWNGGIIGDAGAKALAEALKCNVSLKRLAFWNQELGLAGILALAEALKSNCQLQVLKFVGSSIRPDGMEALAEALKSNTNLQELLLEGAALGEGGAQALATGLKNNNGLQRLQIMGDRIGHGGARALAGALKENGHLLQLQCETLDAESAVEIGGYLERNWNRKMLLTINVEGDKFCCFTISGELIGTLLDGVSVDDLHMTDWCKAIAVSVGRSLDRVDFVGPSNSRIDLKPGLAVRQAVQGVRHSQSI